jgi:hypothetical protein
MSGYKWVSNLYVLFYGTRIVQLNCRKIGPDTKYPLAILCDGTSSTGNQLPNEEEDPRAYKLKGYNFHATCQTASKRSVRFVDEGNNDLEICGLSLSLSFLTVSLEERERS